MYGGYSGLLPARGRQTSALELSVHLAKVMLRVPEHIDGALQKCISCVTVGPLRRQQLVIAHPAQPYVGLFAGFFEIIKYLLLIRQFRLWDIRVEIANWQAEPAVWYEWAFAGVHLDRPDYMAGLPHGNSHSCIAVFPLFGRAIPDRFTERFPYAFELPQKGIRYL